MVLQMSFSIFHISAHPMEGFYSVLKNECDVCFPIQVPIDSIIIHKVAM